MSDLSISDDFKARLNQALALPEEKKFYFNGFAITITPTDVLISLESTHKTIALLKAPHCVAKTLVGKLGSVITKFEQETGYTIPTLEEMEELVKKIDAKS